MNTKLFSAKKLSMIFCTLLIFISLVACKGNRGKLTGKWKVTNAFVLDRAFNEYRLEISERASKTALRTDYEGVAQYKKYKAMEDSLTDVSKKENQFYESGIYQLNDDGSALVNWSNQELNGTWILLEDKEDLLLVIKDKDKTIQQWKFKDYSMNTPGFKKDGTLRVSVNLGGGSFDETGKTRPYVKLTISRIE